jgi:hypothetical protein
MRMRAGEHLGPDSPLISAYGGKPRFLLANNIGDAMRHAMRRAGLDGYPYLWRSYYANRCQLVEAKGFLEAWRKFFQGHTGNIQTRYANRKQGLPPDSIEAMRAAYAKALPVLQSEHKDLRDPRLEMVSYQLQAAGMTEQEVDALDLRSKSPEELMALTRRALAKQLGLPEHPTPPEPPAPVEPAKPAAPSAVRQKVIPMSEIETAIGEGWHYKGEIPGNRAIVETNA